MQGVEIEDESPQAQSTLPLSHPNSPFISGHSPHMQFSPLTQHSASPPHHSHQPMHSPQQQQQQQQQFSRQQPQSSPSQMRQRPKQRAAPAADESSDRVRRLVKTLKTLDVYPKTEDDIAIKTGSGGAVSLVSLAIIALLVITELWAFLHTDTLQVNFDITYPSLRCSDTSIDVMDVSGDVQVAAEKNIHRVRLDANGRQIERGEYEDHAHDDEVAPDPNLNPMLAALGIGFPGGPPQGMQGGPDKHTDQRGEGCRIRGTLLVNKVAGNIHIALGGAHAHPQSADEAKEEGKATGSAHGDHSHSAGHTHGQQQHLHQFMIHELAMYNCSHTINQLSFGPLYPGVVNPLDGVSQVIQEGAGTAHYQYFIKVVPTVYESAFGTSTDTNQFSVTQHVTPISVQDAFRGDAQRIPGVFFVYDLSPFMVRVRDVRVPFSTFLTSICAIVGGVLTVAGVVDSLLFASVRVLKVASPIAKKG